MHNLYSRHAVGRIAKKFNLNYFDIGSRGGFQKDLFPFAFAVNAVGFEPDPVEFSKLKNGKERLWKSVNILPFGVSDSSGRRKLNVPLDPQSASLLEHNTEIGQKFLKPQFFEVKRIEEVETLSLEDSLKQTGFDSVDFLKIDIEGAELLVFKSSPKIMRDVLAIKTEVSFLPFRLGQPLAGDVDSYLREFGFDLMSIIEPAIWRRQGYVTHPYYSTEEPPYSKGQIAHADYLYFRDPEGLDKNIEKLLKLSIIAISFGYFDFAQLIFERPEIANFLTSEFNLSPEKIITSASKSYGRKIFMKEFFRQTRGLVPFLRYMRNLIR